MSESERVNQRESFIECQTGLVDECFSLTKVEAAARDMFLWLRHDLDAKLIFVADQ
ncbi:MAG: hypothetical protein PHP57_08020 [Sideroxydans sp.]|nr:hypothetical protein [Sideroxydans sp.]